MTTFFLMPPRPLVGNHLTQLLGTWFPGLVWPTRIGEELAWNLAGLVEQQGAVVVHREDVPEGMPAEQALRELFGAEAGDCVREVRFGLGIGEVRIVDWQIAAKSASPTAGPICYNESQPATNAPVTPPAWATFSSY